MLQHKSDQFLPLALHSYKYIFYVFLLLICYALSHRVVFDHNDKSVWQTTSFSPPTCILNQFILYIFQSWSLQILLKVCPLKTLRSLSKLRQNSSSCYLARSCIVHFKRTQFIPFMKNISLSFHNEMVFAYFPLVNWKLPCRMLRLKCLFDLQKSLAEGCLIRAWG